MAHRLVERLKKRRGQLGSGKGYVAELGADGYYERCILDASAPPAIQPDKAGKHGSGFGGNQQCSPCLDMPSRFLPTLLDGTGEDPYQNHDPEMDSTRACFQTRWNKIGGLVSERRV